MKALAEVIDEHARRRPEGLAFAAGSRRLSWLAYARRSDRLAVALAARGYPRGSRVAVLLPDGPGVHVAYVGCEKAGLVVVGIGPRAGEDEIRHLIGKTDALLLISAALHEGLDLAGLAAGLGIAHLPIARDLDEEEPALGDADAAALEPRLRLASDELFLLNSTSGTTGLPKCVTHDQARWNHFHELAVDAAAMTRDDVFLSALPAPFGFGLWTAHFTPTLLGCPTVLLERFSPEALIEALDAHRVTVLAAVSTQFIMMLNSAALDEHDLGSLRALFTGGEAVPTERAVEFEERTGAAVLQFYGSNETGALSRTTLADSREVRTTSAGRIIDSMQVRLFDDGGNDVTQGGRGQPGCCGPLSSRGYFADDAANAKLYTADGWMLTGDVATLDRDGVLRIVGRTADFIIRGGKNISGPAVEDAVGRHPAVALAAAVAMPDPVFGERVCVYVELREGADAPSLGELVAFLREDGVSKEWLPERLEVLGTLPRSSGGKVAKGALRADVRRRLAEETGR